jgi:parallel beta-helix repeat protein
MKTFILILCFTCPFVLFSQNQNYYVDNLHPKASDSNTGSVDLPFKTINKAAQLAGPGDTVFVANGIYRERVAPLNGGKKKTPVVYKAVGKDVYIKGSEVVHNKWKQIEDNIYKVVLEKNWFSEFNPFLIKAKDLKGDRTLGQIFVDSQIYSEVDNESSLFSTPCSWKIENDGYTLLIHFGNEITDPNKVITEITTRNRIFAPHKRGLGNIVVDGFIMEHCSNQFPSSFWVEDREKGYPQAGALSTRSGSNWMIMNNTIRWANTIGIDCGIEGGYDVEGEQPRPEFSGNHIIQNNTISYNGACGIAGAGSPGTKILYNYIEGNNFLGWTSPETGGIKVHWFTEGLIEGNICINNDAHGIWLDNGCINSRVTRNVVVNSRGSGIFIEMADGPCLVDNNVVAYTHAGDGIYAHDASGITIAHNLLYANEHFGVLMRTVTDRKTVNEKGEKVLVGTHDETVVNNIFIDNYRGQLSFPLWGNARTYNNKSDYNIFISGTTWKWEGLIHNPFVINTTTGVGTSREDVTRAFMQHFRELNFSGDSATLAHIFNRQPVLSFEWWKIFTGNDKNSFAPGMQKAELENGAVRQGSMSFSTGELFFETNLSAPFKQINAIPIIGIDYDFFGNKLEGDQILPGPFQFYNKGHSRFLLIPKNIENR